MPINRNDVTKEMVEKAKQCNNADELIALAKDGGITITKDEAEAYMAELADLELDSEGLQNIAAGGCYQDCNPHCHHCPYDL